ncbi:uncharacterized protein LTR77_001479 [Saxophila tyrrhenica]|uniref:Uncharacterized protein n=1 Tax=Saxophila tyrrhenica TaxID=1690608 RepID=A0AAV9PNT6_9PEZI|nr:hypothetical protein LTR77_001479 [Saxophila tyrrhenica]
MISPEEFEALPPSIQRKCFSPAERLRINQQSQAHKRRKQTPSPTWPAPPLQAESIRRAATSAGLSECSNDSVVSAATPTMITVKQKKISEEQARWFLMLPEKVRRQQFSREEHLTLLIRCKEVLEPSRSRQAKDSSHRGSSFSRPQSCMSLLPKDRPSTSTATSVNTTTSFLDTDAASVRTTDTSNAEMKIFNLYTGCGGSVSAHNDIVATVPNLPSTQPQPHPSDIATPKKRPAFRRYSLRPLPIPPPVLAPPVPLLPSQSPPASPASSRPLSLSARLSRPYVGLFTSVFELEADPVQPVQQPVVESRAYDDEDIRKRLRRTLLSPEKFEEVLEFGFSADEECPPSASSSDSTLRFDQPASSGSEYDGDNDGDSEDDDTSVEACPRTPTPLSGDLFGPAIKQSSLDSGIGTPLSQIEPFSPTATCGPTTSNGNREMTVHMTLTRPGLRSPEDELYSAQRQQTSGVDVEKHDPLALQVLPVCDDPSGAQGAFAVRRSGSRMGLRNVWKSLVKH